MRYLIILLLIVSCKAKQPLVITNTVRDTINIETIRTVQIPIKTEIIIEKPCDSLGLLRDFKETFKTEKVYVTLTSSGGNIDLDINLDSLESVFISKYEGKKEVITKIVEVDKPVPFIPKWVYWLLGYSVLSTLFAFRKFIPVLKFLPF